MLVALVGGFMRLGPDEADMTGVDFPDIANESFDENSKMEDVELQDKKEVVFRLEGLVYILYSQYYRTAVETIIFL